MIKGCGDEGNQEIMLDFGDLEGNFDLQSLNKTDGNISTRTKDSHLIRT